MCTGAEGAAAAPLCATGASVGAANALTMGADYAGLGAMGDMAATGAGAGMLGADALGMGAMTAGELGAGFGANMAASGYGGTAAEGLGTLGGAEIGAANAGTMGGDYATAFGQGGIAPQASSLGADVINPATNLPAAATDVGTANAGTMGSDYATGLQGANYGAMGGDGTSAGLGQMFSNAGSWMAKNPLASIYGGASLYDMYAKNQMASAQQNQMNKINSMYAPGSPEYNLMMQQIARKDAAAGRNSQYGPRAQTLAGTIADKKASLLGSSGYQNLANSQLNNKFGAMNTPVSLATMYALTNK